MTERELLIALICQPTPWEVMAPDTMIAVCRDEDLRYRVLIGEVEQYFTDPGEAVDAFLRACRPL